MMIHVYHTYSENLFLLFLYIFQYFLFIGSLLWLVFLVLSFTLDIWENKEGPLVLQVIGFLLMILYYFLVGREFNMYRKRNKQRHRDAVSFENAMTFLQSSMIEAPILKLKVRCFHIDDDMCKVVTHTDEKLLDIKSWRNTSDLSYISFSSAIDLVTPWTLSTAFRFGDRETIDAFKQLKLQLIESNKDKDEGIEFTYDKIVPSFRDDVLFYYEDIIPYNESVWLLILVIFFVSWPYRCYMKYMRVHKQIFSVIKEISILQNRWDGEEENETEQHNNNENDAVHPNEPMLQQSTVQPSAPPLPTSPLTVQSGGLDAIQISAPPAYSVVMRQGPGPTVSQINLFEEAPPSYNEATSIL